MKELYFGICEPGIRHASNIPNHASIETKFQMVKEADAFDYIDVTPLPEEVDEYERCSQKYEIPILAGGTNYILGLEEKKLEQNIRIGARLGSHVHNTMVFMDHADGHFVSNEEIVSLYLNMYELGDKLGCVPTFETHVNLWTEKFTRVLEVAQLVEDRGVPFRITLDQSHLIFKLNNPVEQAVFGLDQLIESGELVIDPFQSGNVFEKWISKGFVRHAHARSVAPNNPKNIWGTHSDIHNLRSSLHPKSTVGRGIQYPFVKPEKGQWHSDWHESELEPWKQVVKMLMTYHASSPQSELKTISAEFIPFTDYGEGSSYSLLENNKACAHWLRSTWQEISSE